MLSSILSSVLLLGAASAAAIGPEGNQHGEQFGKFPCDEQVTALATGIHINIIGQHAEFNGTKMVMEVETASNPSMEAFYIAKGELLSDIQGGMNIRLFNQEIAPPGNPAIPGLAKYAAAQQTEQNLAEGLTGDYATDKSALDSLMSDIMAGIKLNMNNLKEATSQCDLLIKFPPANQMG